MVNTTRVSVVSSCAKDCVEIKILINAMIVKTRERFIECIMDVSKDDYSTKITRNGWESYRNGLRGLFSLQSASEILTFPLILLFSRP